MVVPQAMFELRLFIEAFGEKFDQVHTFQLRPTLTDVEAAIWQYTESNDATRLQLLSCGRDCRVGNMEAAVSPGAQWTPLLAASQLMSGCCVRASFLTGINAMHVKEAERLSTEQRKTAEARLRAARAESRWLELRQQSAEDRQYMPHALERSHRSGEAVQLLRAQELERLEELQRLRSELAQQHGQPYRHLPLLPGGSPQRISTDTAHPPAGGSHSPPRFRTELSPERRAVPPHEAVPTAAPPWLQHPPPSLPGPPRHALGLGASPRAERPVLRYELKLRNPAEPAGMQFGLGHHDRVIVAGISIGGPAHIAGVSEGAIVKRINGYPILTLDDVRTARGCFYQGASDTCVVLDVEPQPQADIEEELNAQREREEKRRLARRHRELGLSDGSPAAPEPEPVKPSGGTAKAPARAAPGKPPAQSSPTKLPRRPSEVAMARRNSQTPSPKRDKPGGEARGGGRSPSASPSFRVTPDTKGTSPQREPQREPSLAGSLKMASSFRFPNA
eukprot:Hpha_TRINITY_DN11221_c0_g1::TRINITY_DN11221_c0_g1_i1::g.167616::m.167616